MVRLDYYDPNYGLALMLHRSLGMALLSLACLQIAWKLVSPSPPIQIDIPPWQRIAARGMHGLLLLLIVAIPVSGYLLTTSAGSGFVVFGLFNVPAVLPVTDTVRDWAETVHYFASYGFLVLVAGHAGAAIKHQIWDGVGTLRRMI